MIPYADRDNPGSYPASFGQEAMWVNRQLHAANNLLHNLLWQISFSGPLDPKRLTDALQVIVNRHEPLRSSFRVVNDDLLQVVSPSLTVTCPLEDLSSLHIEEKASRLHALTQSFGLLPFDIEMAPLVRFRLVRLGGEEHRLLASFHHMVTDGGSWPLFFNELSAVYAGEALPSLSSSYGDYAAKQRSLYAEGAWNRHREYWLDRFSAGVPVLDIPLPRPRPVDSHSRGGVCEEVFPSALKDELKALAGRNQSSLFRVLLAACVVLLYRLTGQTDVVLGTALTGRSRRELNDLIGLFVDLAPLKFVLEDGLPFVEVLKKVHDELDGAVAHEEYPYPLVVKDINPVRELGRESLLQVTLTKLPATVEKRIGNLHLKEERIFLQLSQQDLWLYSQEIPQGIRMVCEYGSDRFDSAAVRSLIVHFRTLLEGIAACPESSINDLPLLPEFERRQLLVEWNDTGREYPRNACIHELFEAQAQRTPEAVAVVLEGDCLTYREIDERANHLAHHLRKLGVGPEVLVGLCVERSLEMVVGLLGILKAGGAYVPLDPEYPQERLSFMMEDTRAPVLLTQERLRGVVPLGMAQTVYLDSYQQIVSGEAGPPPTSGVTADNLAYVMYTSGSTGRPKGVEIPHRGVVRLLLGNDYTLFDERQVFLQLAPISFDASTFEIWGALLHGAKCVLYPGRIPDVDKLGEVIRQHGVTTLWLTASLFNAFIDDAPEVLQGVSRILTGGEQLSPRHVRRAYDSLSHACIINGYGPTESTTFTTCYPIPVEMDGESAVPIGRPIANTKVYILDRNVQPVPLGIPGELYIGGDGLARGYLNRADLTEERFIPDPFRTERGARLYKTGDLVRYCLDGTIDFLGRLDDQVKIRGFRIEPGEIEAVLKLHPGVKQAVVIARADTPGERRLVGYVVPEHGALDIGELRGYLKQSVPDYMVPTAFVQLDQIPLTANGKINRRALPAPERGAAVPESAQVLARTHVEKQLSDVWEEIFHVPSVSVDANFFDLGGHSLLAVKLMARIGRVFGKQLPLNALFESPTIEALAKNIEEGDRTVGPHTLVSIQASGSRPPIFWIPGGAALGLFRLHHLVTRLGPEQPVFGLGSSHPKSVEDIETVEERAAHYLELVRRVQPHGPYCFAGFCAGGLVAFEMAQRLVADGEAVPFVGLINCFFPRHRTGPLDTLWLRGQRLRRQLRAASAQGMGLTGYVRKKLGERRKAQIAALELREAASQVKQGGFRPDSSSHDQVLLNATAKVFERYRPSFYPGYVALFNSEDEDFVGVSRRFDPRLAWTAWTAEHEIRAFPGGHEGIVETPFAVESADILKAALENALDRYASGQASVRP